MRIIMGDENQIIAKTLSALSISFIKELIEE